MKKIALDKQKLGLFCMDNCIKRFALLGSILTDDFRPESDVDVLVEFEDHVKMDLVKYVRLARSIGELFFNGRHVDLVTYKGLRPLLKDAIIKSSEVQYEKAA
jgi:predicted nucleotidyltransferase